MVQGTMSEEERREVRDAFREAVNMTPAELHRWLDTEDSRSVGMTEGGEKVTHEGGHEEVGHEMGRHILEIAGRRQSEHDEQDYEMMRKVVGYVHRHSAQRPKGDVTDTRWRHSLMNWGHDPLKK